MGKLTFYYFWGSQPCRAVYMLLRHSQVEFTERIIRLDKGEQKREEFVNLVPTGCVPAIEDDGFILTESDLRSTWRVFHNNKALDPAFLVGLTEETESILPSGREASVAILQYLTSKYSDKVAPHWYPTDVRLRARVDEYMNWQHTNIRKYGDTHFMTKFVYPVFRRSPVDNEKLRLTSGDLNKALDFIENHFLKNTDYLAGDDITLADLLGVSEVMQPLAGGYDVTHGRPKLALWLERVKSKLGPIFEETHEKLFEITSPC